MNYLVPAWGGRDRPGVCSVRGPRMRCLPREQEGRRLSYGRVGYLWRYALRGVCGERSGVLRKRRRMLLSLTLMLKDHRRDGDGCGSVSPGQKKDRVQ